VQVLEFDKRAGSRLAAVIDEIPRDRWSAPTPCSEWTVRDLVRHLIAGNVKYTAIAQGGQFTSDVPVVTVGNDAAERYRQTLAQMLEAWRAPGALDREIDLPRGQRGPAEVAAWIHLAETLGHGWDLATATGQEPGFEDDVVTACLDECRRRMPPHRGSGSAFADAVDAPDGPPIRQLAAYLGRRNQPEAP
jgi:uncharacterized protein (TIGR03086 family)